MSSSKKIAIVTGASSGIGRSCAIALVKDGWSVVLSGRRKEELEQTAKLAGGDTLVVQSDVTKVEDVDRLFETAKSHYGRLDLLFNNAGVNLPGVALEDMTLEQWQNVVDVNLNGPFLCTQRAIRIFKSQSPQGGRIINNGSISAQVPRPDSAPYTATKHAITGLTKSTILDGRKYNIACGQIDVGNASSPLAKHMEQGVPQADGSIKPEPLMAVENVAKSIVYMAGLPLDANVPFLTVCLGKKNTHTQ